MKKLKIILFFFLLLFLRSNIISVHAYTGDNSIQINLGVEGCNNNGTCESSLGETLLSCPSDCTVIIPPVTPSGRNNGHPIPVDISISNIIIDPNYTVANISWKSSIGTLSTIKWGENTDVKEGTLSDISFAIDHKIQLINLKPGTMYYFIIESKDVLGRIQATTPLYFFTKFLKDTSYPLAPLNLKAKADKTGVTLSWKNPSDKNFSYIRIMRNENRFQGDPFLGKLIYEGKSQSFLDKNVLAGKKYFYTAYARDTANNFSTGVGVSITAYSPKIIPPVQIPTKPVIPVDPKPETFFVYQYNQPVEPLVDTKKITIDKNKSTVVDTNIKTLPDDWMEVKNKNGELLGQYLFSLNKDSERYQSVLPPLDQPGDYNIKIYRYKNNVPTLISEGSLSVNENTTLKTEKVQDNTLLYFIYKIAIFLALFLIFFILKNRYTIKLK